jgi:hypothetical protein
MATGDCTIYSSSSTWIPPTTTITTPTYTGGWDSATSSTIWLEKDIRQDDEGFYSVIGEVSGRSFGRYETLELAKERADQLGIFYTKHIKDLDDRTLAAILIELDSDVDGADDLDSMVAEELAWRMTQRGITKAESAESEEARFTLAPWYVPDTEDAHGEFVEADDLQQSLWDFTRKGDRTVYFQHTDEPVGEIVEGPLQFPFEITASLEVPGESATEWTFPAGTPFVGVVWSKAAWPLVKEGKIRGMSMGGRVQAISEAPLPSSARAQ